MNGEEFGEELYRENLYFVYEDKCKELEKELENLKKIEKEHQRINGELREELEFEKATNKELLSTGAELENKLYEEQDKNKRLNNIINDFEEELEREVNIKKEDTGLEHNTYIDINNTLKTVLKRFRELKGSDKE